MSTDVATLVLAVDANQVRAGGEALDNLSTRGRNAEQQTNRLTSATNVLSTAYRDVAKAFAAWKVADFVRDTAMMAARFETMGIVMKIAGNNAGYTRAETEKYSKALQEQGISMMQSRDAIVQLSTANIDLSKAADLARAAQDLAVVGNINSSEAMQRMIHGIKSGEIEILRTLGMNVSWEASYKKLAAQIGTTSDKLTEQQKVMARTTAVVEEGIKYQGIYEEAMGTAGKAITSLTRYWDNLKIKMGEIFLPALSDAVDTLTRALKASNAELDKASKDGTVQNYGKSLALMVEWSTKAAMLIGNGFLAAVEYIGRLAGAAAAQAKFLWEGNITGSRAVTAAWKADNEAALASAQAFHDQVMNAKPPSTQAPKTPAMTEEERIKQAEASRKQAEADAKALKNSNSLKAAKDSEASAYDRLVKSIREKIAAMEFEGDGQTKLTEAQKTTAKITSEIEAGELRLTAAHKANIFALLEKQDAVEKQNQGAKAYAEALKAINQTVVTAEDATRELSDAQRVLLDLMRAPEWEAMPDVWKQTAIAATATATAQLEVIKAQNEINFLLEQTPTRKLKEAQEQMVRLADAYLAGSFGIRDSTEAILLYGEAVDVALGRNAEALVEQASALDEFTKSAAQNMQKALADFLFDPFANGTKTMVQQFGITVQKMIAQAVSADLMKRLFGDIGRTGEIGGWLGSIMSSLSGSSSSISTPLAGSLGAAGGLPLPSFDTGTDYVPKDMIARIHAGEKIIPASQNKQQSDNKTINNVYNVTVQVPEGSPSESRRAAGTGAREGLMIFASAKRYS